MQLPLGGRTQSSSDSVSTSSSSLSHSQSLAHPPHLIMPSESAAPPPQADQGLHQPLQQSITIIKCPLCGAAGSTFINNSWTPFLPVTVTDTTDRENPNPLLQAQLQSTAPQSQSHIHSHSSFPSHRQGNDPPMTATNISSDLHQSEQSSATAATVSAGGRVCHSCARLGIDGNRLRNDMMEQEQDQKQDRERHELDPIRCPTPRTSIRLGLQLELGIDRGVVDPLDASHASGDPDSTSSTNLYPKSQSPSQLPIPIPSQIASPNTSSSSIVSGSRTQHAHSLPTQPALPWLTTRLNNRHYNSTHSASSAARDSSASSVTSGSNSSGSSRAGIVGEVEERAPNRLLDVTRARTPSIGRGCLFPGSVFKGTQTSGRSAYDVEVRILDVNFPESTLCGYLSISHLTDSHPHLTTFFTGEIIGPKYGFITGSRFGATEHDDMRHWGRFEQFRRASTRADFVRPDLLLRDPVADASKGETWVRERDFVFLRIKERFLVPDHTVRDISGASFAGFYYAMVDLSPTLGKSSEEPNSPTAPHTSNVPTNPVLPRRSSSLTSSVNQASSASRPETGKQRRESSAKIREQRSRDATIRGYYFHSLNQEPFQELFLSHEPSRSSSTFEMR